MYLDLTGVQELQDAWAEDSIPENVWSLLKDVPLFVPDDLDETVESPYTRAMKGHCMTCDGKLGELTMVCVNRAGIITIFCGGACYTDMQVTGWIEEQYEDLVQKIKFRGGKGDVGDEPDS